jgi:MtrB/PioB family decaheme-associated outer membrane protein
MNKVLGGVSMKRRIGLVSQCLLGAILTAAASGSALAQSAGNGTDAFAADLPLKAPPAATEPTALWWFHGSVEAGYRGFLNSPQNGYQTANGPAGFPGVQGNSLAKYYEYSDIKPGMFGNVWMSAGTKDGLYQVDLGGTNIGYNDQAYWLDFSKAGQFYFNFGWDETPHVYSTSALTPYVVNGSAVTLNPCGATGTKTTAILLAPCAQPTDIGIQRDTGSFQGRWTPDDTWDIKADYSHMTRTGTQVSGMFGGVAPTLQLPKPVDDLTQNYGLNAEHVGTSPWGQRYSVKLGYVGSTYTDNISSFSVQSANAAQPFGARDATWPSNQANGFAGTLAADLPWKSRYVGQLNYTMMTQNQAFIPNNTNPVDQTVLPASSLNGAINTLLSYNQLTTKITPTLTSKLTYRYYDYNNQTPELFFASNPNRDYTLGTPTDESVHSLAMAYTKQNAGVDLNWRPTKEWNLGAAYGFERYDWTRADVDVTNENSGKLYGDWKPFSWFTLRASGSYGDRTYDNYNYAANVGYFQWSCPNSATCDASEMYSSTYRQLMIDDRQQWKANVSADLDVIHNLTVSPFIKYVESKYGVDPTTQQGLQDARKTSAGIDVSYVLNANTSFMVGYVYDWGSSLLYGINCNGNTQASPTTVANCVPPVAAPGTLTNDTTTVQTFTAAVKWAAIPQKLDTELRYTASHGVDNMQLFVGNAPPTGGQFPENTTWFQRLDATAVYTFDKETVAQMGWTGTVKAKLHYVWERNAESNWANDPLTPYSTLTGMTTTLWLAWDNPNYNVQMLMASLVASW